MAIISKNSEILFLYDAKLSNPNGDMDNENKPRMDWDTNTNLVSDVRLKRYIRDYFEQKLGLDIFVTSKAEDAKKRNEQLKKDKKGWMDMIDCRIFGVVTASEQADQFTGPVQFNWGYSLNKVELNQSHTITSSFSSGGGVGKDFRVNYSFLAFNGSINAEIAKSNNAMSDDDLKLFDEAMIYSIPFCRTRSKIGQTPRLYLRVEMKNPNSFLKDLREYISINFEGDEFNIRKIDEITVNMDNLFEYLEKNKDKIQIVHYWKDDNVKIKDWDTNIKKINSKEMVNE